MITIMLLYTVVCAPLLLRIAGAADTSFDPLHHSGAASPYFDAPSQYGIDTPTPDGCIVDQAAYIVRHGSRYPEPGSYAGWVSLYEKFQNSTYTAHGPTTFIPSWVPPVDDVPHEPLYLTTTGAGEAFALGVDLRKRYGLTPGGSNITVWSAGQQRVVDTASYFLSGYLSQGSYTTAISSPSKSLNRGHVVVLPDSVNYTFADSLTPSSGCPLYPSGDTSGKATTFRSSFRPAVAARVNTYLDGLVLDSDDIGPMQDLCGFGAEVAGRIEQPFCDLFTESEWKDYEYAHDLNYYYGSGPGNPFSATTGFPWVKAVTDLFLVGPNKTTSNGTFTPPPLLMSFTHDNNIPPIISALGIFNESSYAPLDPVRANENRKFRSSYMVSFRGYVALERLSCEPASRSPVRHTRGVIGAVLGKGDKAKKYVRVRVNNAPVPLPHCSSGPGSSCPLASFGDYILKTQASKAGDFVRTCGLSNVSNATGEFTAFTQKPSADEVFLLPLRV